MIRVSQGAHLYNETLRRLSLHPRLVRPAQQLLGTAVHVYQSRLTIKPGLNGSRPASGWEWHQDYVTWCNADGMPEPRALVTFTFLDDVTAANAPVLVIPRSHQQGVIGESLGPEDGGDGSQYEDMIIQPETLRELANRGGVTALTGPIGTVAYMHCALVHSSTENISPLRRALFAVVFNPVDNRPQHPRTDHYATANVVPVKPLAEDCLFTMVR